MSGRAAAPGSTGRPSASARAHRRAWLARLPRRALMLPVRAYRLLLSPWVGRSCRFEPTCSRYALEALERHGALAGTVLAGWRILRCHPGCDGGCDPVPDNPPWPTTARGLFTRLLPGRPAAPATESTPSSKSPS